MQKKKYYKKLIRKKSINQMFRYLPRGPVNLSFSINRGALEKAFLWKKTMSFWLIETVGGMFQNPGHRNIWVWPMLNRYEKIWITFFLRHNLTGWICLWESWSFKRFFITFVDEYCSKQQVVLSLLFLSFFFEIFYCVCLLVVFLLIFFYVLLPKVNIFFYFFFFTLWFVFFFSKIIIIFFILAVCFFTNWIVKKNIYFKNRKLPRWSVKSPLAHPTVSKNICFVNTLSRQQHYYHYYFTWLGSLVRPTLLNSHFCSLRNTYFLNSFGWESKYYYHRRGKWPYNVTYDFWFDYYYNYPTFADCVLNLRDLPLQIHPFLFFRQIMTESALPLLRQSSLWRNYLQHFAKNFLIWRIGLFSIWVGRSVLSRYYIFCLYFRAVQHFFFDGIFLVSLQKCLNRAGFYHYTKYFSAFITPLLETNPIVASLLLLSIYSMTNFVIGASGRFKYFFLQHQFFIFYSKFFYQFFLTKNMQFSFPYVLWRDSSDFYLYQYSSPKIFIKNFNFYIHYKFFFFSEPVFFFIPSFCKKKILLKNAKTYRLPFLFLQNYNRFTLIRIRQSRLHYFFFIQQFYLFFLSCFFSHVLRKIK